MYYPNMYPELLEAIHTTFVDEPHVELDCLLYLTNLRDNWSRVAELSSHASDMLEDKGLCPTCGTQMVTETRKEYHPELVGRTDYPFETVTTTYCPVCDLGDEG